MGHEFRLLRSDRIHEGRVISVRRDELAMPGDTTAWREVVEHPGAVAVVALDDAGQVVLVRQYRHPVARPLDELPAGLLDKDGEPAVETARRELAEEAGLAAGTWHVLVDLLTSPGMTDEATRVFLARGLREVHRDVQEHEEAELTSFRRPLDEVVEDVLAGRYENALLVAGVLAADRAVHNGFRGLREVEEPWPSRPGR